MDHNSTAGKLGSPSAYFNGCTCDECKAAGKHYRTFGTFTEWKEGRARKPPLFHPFDRTEPFDPTDDRHGGISAYTMGCRCPRCTAAGAHYRAEKKAGRKLPKGWRAE